MFEDNIFAAIADGTLLDTISSFFLRQSIPGSITARNAQGHNYLEAALWIRTRTWEELNSELVRQRRLSKEQAKWYRSELERDAEGVHKKSEEIVRYLLTEHPALLNQQDDTGVTPLMRFSTYQPASYTGGSRQVEVVPLLLQYKPQGDLQDKQGRTALHYAAEKGAVAVINQLCKAFPSIINVQTREGYAALHLAAQNNTTDKYTHIDKITTLVAAKANVNIADENGQLPLHHYVLAKMQNVKKDTTQPFRLQTTPPGFYDLLRSPFIATVKLLRDASYSALACKDNHGQTALSLAFNQLTPESSPAVRAHFLTLCAFYCYKNEDGVSQADLVMSLAEQSKGLLFIYLFAHPTDHNLERKFQVAEDDPVCHLDSIMEALAQIDSGKLTSLLQQSKDEAGRTLIHHIVQKRVMDFLRRYDGRSLDLNAMDNDGNTPLHVLLSKDIEDIKAPAAHECFAYLCEQGAKVNVQNQADATPLHLAVNHGVLSYTKTLLGHGADLSIQDQAGRTPIHVHIRARQRSSMMDVRGKQQYCISLVPQRLHSYLALLLRHASDETICLQDKRGRTALHEAIRVSDVVAVTCLLIRCPQLLDIKDSKGRTPLELAQLQQQKVSTRSYHRHHYYDDMSSDKEYELMKELQSDSKKVQTYLANTILAKTSPMTSTSSVETSSRSVEAANAQIKAYAHDQDMISLEGLSKQKPHKPSEPQTTYARSYEPHHPSPDQYDRYHRQLQQYRADKAAFERTKTELFADLRELVQMGNLTTDYVHVSLRAEVGSTSAVPSSSSMMPESSSSISPDSAQPAPQDGVKDALSVTFMPPSPSPSSSTSLPSLSSSQPSCSYDITRRP